MGENRRGRNIDKLFSTSMLLLCVIGLLINIVLSKLVIFFGLPLYIDNVGSVLVAALGGAIPGMAIGFISNLINSVSNPISMYYGILTILNALTAAWFSRRGYLRSVKGYILLACCMMIIGGAAGSIMTWLLYGAQIGGIAAPLAKVFHAYGFSKFAAQFTADMVIDVADKLLTVAIVYGILHHYPKRLYDVFPYSFLYDRDQKEITIQRDDYYETSVNIRIIKLISVTCILIGGISIFVGIRNYQLDLTEKYESEVTSASRMVAGSVNGDKVDEFLKEGHKSESFVKNKKRVYNILKNSSNVKYVYVYQMKEDGCHVIFDFDSAGVKADKLGDVVPFDKGFEQYKTDLIKGKEIKPLRTNDSYGWLITAYTPIKNQAGVTVAYGCADISMEKYINDLLIYIIKMLSMMFGISLCICSLALWYATRKITNPIQSIVNLTRQFYRTPADQWLESKAWKERPRLNTRDEIEELYHTVCDTQENISINVSKMKETEKQLVKSYELEKKNKELALEVRKADELNLAKTEFYSRMSHDMRTPMNGIIGLVHLSEGEENIDVLHENIEKIESASQYLLALINDTLDMSKIESNKMQLQYQAISIQRLIQEIGDIVNPGVKQKNQDLHMNVQVKAQDILLLMDVVRVKQIIVNLLSNAMKFTPEDGEISIDILEKKEENQRKHYQVRICDSGCGMSEDYIKHHIFEPFSQEQNSITMTSAGSGLGLAIVKNLVDLMGGTIQVESKLGEGSVFTVDLDFEVVESEESEEIKNHEISQELLKGKRVLICEDHPLNQEILTKILLKVGIQSDSATNGEIGIHMFMDAKEGFYDAIFMDVRMPVMDGITTSNMVRQLPRKDAKNIPIIAMTANAYEEDKKVAFEAGMNEYLSKPIQVEELYQVLIKHLT